MARRIVIGDIHGCIRTFRNLLENKIQPGKSDTIILLGDYIDRGPDSKAVVDYVMDLQRESYQVHSLMGNHEYMLLHAIDSKEFFSLWMLNSGNTTLLDFGIDVDKYNSQNFVKHMPVSYLEFFNNLRYYLETEGFLITHGCFEGATEYPLDDINSMIWRRVESYNEDFLKGRKLIHGHTPMPLNEIRRRTEDPDTLIFNLDAGCVYRNNPSLGHLAAMELDSRKLIVVKNCE